MSFGFRARLQAFKRRKASSGRLFITVARRLSLAATAVALILTTSAGMASPHTSQTLPAATNWIEAESLTGDALPVDVVTKLSPPDALLSGGQWIKRTFEKAYVEKIGPADIRLRCVMTASAGSERTLWARVDFEGARAPLEWRAGAAAGGTENDWRRVDPGQHTAGLTRLADSTAIVWLRRTSALVSWSLVL